MESLLYVGAMVVLWVFNLLNGTGLGNAYHTTELAMILVVLLSLFLVWRQNRRQGAFIMDKRYFYTLLLMTVLFVGMSVIKGHKWMGLAYMWAFLVTYILSLTRPSRKIFRLVGFCYACLGAAILYIFSYMDALDGWNANSIAMIGLFSFLVFIIPYYGIRDLRSFFMLTLVGVAYVILLWPTGSRSCIIAIIASLVLIFRVVSIEKVMSSRAKIIIALLVPLIVLVLVCILSVLGNVTGWDQWSMEQFGKPIFNGRDLTWIDGLKRLQSNFLFGSGYIDSGYWHNSAIACLTAYGTVGYALWVRLHYLILSDTIPYQSDVCVQGAITAFMVIFWQQAVELGLFAPNPNLLPFAMLGMLLGRCRYLEEKPW